MYSDYQNSPSLTSENLVWKWWRIEDNETGYIAYRGPVSNCCQLMDNIFAKILTAAASSFPIFTIFCFLFNFISSWLSLFLEFIIQRIYSWWDGTAAFSISFFPPGFFLSWGWGGGFRYSGSTVDVSCGIAMCRCYRRMGGWRSND